MSKIITIILVLFIFISSCYTIEQVRNEHDRTFKQEILLDVWFIQQFNAPGECDPQSEKEICFGLYRMICNGHKKWEPLEKCPTSCAEVADQDLVVCQ
jgi:hypothetical protein